MDEDEVYEIPGANLRWIDLVFVGLTALRNYCAVTTDLVADITHLVAAHANLMSEKQEITERVHMDLEMLPTKEDER